MELEGDLDIYPYKVVTIWSEYEYCLDAGYLVLTFTREALCLANRRSWVRIMAIYERMSILYDIKNIFSRRLLSRSDIEQSDTSYYIFQF